MAGAGYKLFNTGDVLTAAQVNTYLMQQTVMVFASATARNTALSGILAEGLVCYLTDTNDFQIYDGAAWQSYGSGDITGVTAGTGISGGGTSGNVTITNSMATEITAAGDIIVGTGSGTFDNLPIGTTGQVLTADTTVSPYKVKWASASSTPSFVGCRVRLGSNLSISDATVTAITWNTETFDTDGFHSTSSNTSRMTIPSGKAGKYLVTAQLFMTMNDTKQLIFYLYKNGSVIARAQNQSGSGNNLSVNYSDLYDLAVGDYLEVYMFQNNGSATDLVALSDTTAQVSFFNVQFLGA